MRYADCVAIKTFPERWERKKTQNKNAMSEQKKAPWILSLHGFGSLMLSTTMWTCEDPSFQVKFWTSSSVLVQMRDSVCGNQQHSKQLMCSERFTALQTMGRDRLRTHWSVDSSGGSALRQGFTHQLHQSAWQVLVGGTTPDEAVIRFLASADPPRQVLSALLKQPTPALKYL